MIKRCFSNLKRRKRLPFIPTNITTPTVEEAVNNILYNSSETSTTPSTRHVLNCLVSNEPGVLSRVSGILAGRGFNIESLVVASTEINDLSRMTIVLNGQDGLIDQAKKQLEDIVPVWAVLDYSKTSVLEREILLVKVSTVPAEYMEDADIQQSTGVSPLLTTSIQRQSLSELSKLFGARIVDVSLDSVIIELTAKPTRVDAFMSLVRPYGIIEATRSGAMAMPRTPMDYDESKEPELVQEAVDATLLPPG